MISIKIKTHKIKIKMKLKIKREIEEKLFTYFIKSLKRRIENNDTISIASSLTTIKKFIIKKAKTMLKNDKPDFLKLNSL